jgi:hypothetical protein
MRMDQTSRSVPEVDVTDLSGGRWAPRRLRAILRWEGLRGVTGRASAARLGAIPGLRAAARRTCGALDVHAIGRHQ